MKTVNSLLLSLVIAIGFSSPMVWAGEPNPDAVGQSTNISGSGNSKAMMGDCGPDTILFG